MPINYGRRIAAPSSSLSAQSLAENNTSTGLIASTATTGSITNRQIYRGLVSGIAFVTGKGYRGQRLDSLWSKYVYESLTDDDAELCEIAMQSCLADANAVIAGGECGAPYYIGNFAFYCNTQFDAQAEHLKAVERKNVNPALYLTPGEWDDIDAKLDMIAVYGIAKVNDIIRGDNLLSLAVRKSAFQVAKVLLKYNLDPTQVNEEHEDCIMLLKKQATKLVFELRECEAKRAQASKEIVLPSVMKPVLEKDQDIVRRLGSIVGLLPDIIPPLTGKVDEIEKQKRLKRLAEIRREKISFETQFLISQEPQIQAHITFLMELGPYLEGKLARHKEREASYTDYGTRVRKISNLPEVDYKQLRHSLRLSINDPSYINDQLLIASAHIFGETGTAAATATARSRTGTNTGTNTGRSDVSGDSVNFYVQERVNQLHELMHYDERRKSISQHHELTALALKEMEKSVDGGSTDGEELNRNTNRPLLLTDDNRARGDNNNSNNNNNNTGRRVTARSALESRRSELGDVSEARSDASGLFKLPVSSVINSKKSKYSAPIGILQHTENSIVMYR